MQYIVYNTYYTLHSIKIGGDKHGHTEEERCIGGMRPFGFKERSFVWLPDHTGCFRLHRGNGFYNVSNSAATGVWGICDDVFYGA